MSPQRIKTFLDAVPFEPFTIHTGDGSSVNVLSREFVYLLPGRRTLLVSVPRIGQPKTEADFEEHHIDVFLITKVTTPMARAKKNRRRAS